MEDYHFTVAVEKKGQKPHSLRQKSEVHFKGGGQIKPRMSPSLKKKMKSCFL